LTEVSAIAVLRATWASDAGYDIGQVEVQLVGEGWNGEAWLVEQALCAVVRLDQLNLLA